ncbi:ATP-dependent helicase [Burkholderiaceae bacterium DAT-1]|nr:ATP-dependent helicase [Burkholderiaceae bacterium DAT-1]
MLISPTHLTHEQRDIIAESQRSQLVFATAGSGKSTTLAHAILQRLRDGIEPNRMLVLTHSQPGRRRLNQLLDSVKGSGAMPQVVTVHALGMRLYERLVDHGWLQEGATLVTRHEHGEQLRELMFEAMAAAAQDTDDDAFALNTDNADTLLYLIDLIKAKRELARQDHVDSYGDDEWLAEQLGVEPRVLAVYRHFERIRRHRGWITFADQIHEPLQTFVREPESRRLAFLGAEYVVIDEVNDLSRAQLQLIRLVAGPRAIVLAAGDESQCIQLEHGSEPRLMREEFATLFPRVRSMSLSGSFRFGSKLAGAMRRFMTRSAEPPFTECQSLSQRDTSIDRIYSADQADEAAQIVKQVKRETGRDRALKDIAILFRDGADRVTTELALIAAGLPYRLLGGAPIGEREESNALMGLLALGGNRLSSLPRPRRHTCIQAALDLILPGHEQVLDSGDIWRLCDFPEELGEFDVLSRHAASLIERSGRNSPIARQARLLSEHGKWLIGIDSEMPAADALTDILSKLAIESHARLRWLDRERLEERLRTHHRLIEWFAREAMTVAHALTAIEQINQRYQYSKREDAVFLGSFAQAKGHEWPVVMLGGLSRDRLPLPYRRRWVEARQHASNERRLFYVGATRAVKRLILIAPEDAALKAANRKTTYTAPPADHQASAFLYELQLRAAHEDKRA